MGFDWEKFLDVAEHLRNYSQEEEYQRTAVGRYYYACYLVARDIYYNLTGVREGTFISHKKLINFFEHSRNNTEKTIGRNLRYLRDNRNAADYNKDFDFIFLSDSKVRSRRIFNLFDKLK